MVAVGQVNATAAGDYAQLQLSKQRQIGLSLAATVVIALSVFSIRNGYARAVQRTETRVYLPRRRALKQLRSGSKKSS
ncbi:MAG: hypothetical protein ABSC72_12245 [Methylovirgula sp.]|jgi:hypothetical protein